MKHCLSDCMLIHDAALGAGLQAGTQCSTAGISAVSGIDGALPPRVRASTRCSTACLIVGGAAKEHCVPNCM